MSAAYRKIIESGVKVANFKIYERDKIWSRYSHDKVDIGEELAKVIRTLNKTLPLFVPLRAFSIGSSAEPQFRILETAFGGGLYLLDIDNDALSIVKSRIQRQRTGHVVVIKGDYNKIFSNSKNIEVFFKHKLQGKKVHLITLHHSLYYCRQCHWAEIFDNLYSKFLAPQAAIHAVLMASKSYDQFSTTWLYNHFAGKFCGCYNDQDLRVFKDELKKRPIFKNAKMHLRTNRVYFYVDDFAKFMAVLWMILLYPEVHRYTLKQKEEITEFIYKKFWQKKRPLVQQQDHLVIYKGINSKGLI
ncbi:MAG: class I SAM-dependent methyltransferase [Candidatus Omnitrophota bacterium]|nr:class I SAM-dependent methyltransferase [Candidatus Omnitrophota bacterium]